MEELSKSHADIFETLRSKGEKAGSFKRLKLDCLTLFIMNDSVVPSGVTKKRNPCLLSSAMSVCPSVCLSPRGGGGEENRNLPLH